eukprot:8438089-Pyramimonas_sp.AAC.1
MRSTQGREVGREWPRPENSNGRRVRQFCKENQLFIATTDAKQVKQTIYGAKGGGGRIDHFAIPVGARDLVEHCSTLRNAGKRLQTIRSRFPRDHVPVGMQLPLGLKCRNYTRIPQTPQLDRHLLMRCVKEG